MTTIRMQVFFDTKFPNIRKSFSALGLGFGNASPFHICFTSMSTEDMAQTPIFEVMRRSDSMVAELTEFIVNNPGDFDGLYIIVYDSILVTSLLNLKCVYSPIQKNCVYCASQDPTWLRN
jgi:hypothetical protein